MGVNDYTWVKENPLSEKALKEMRYIMDGILSGRMEHKQNEWHCGTAHCFAGWGELLGKKADCQRKSIFGVALNVPKGIDPFRVTLEICGLNQDPQEYCMERWGITYSEASMLFAAENTKATLNAMIKRFEKGFRRAW